jgi:HEAT repeat protein
MKNDPILAALSQLDDLQAHTPEGRKQFAKALASKSSLVVAKAARILGDNQASEFTEDLVNAFGRFLGKGAASDRGCAALTALARALFRLDCDDAALFRRGMKHVQMEGTWGGSEDVAAELRAVCGMGLANTRDPRRLRDLVELLADRQWPARAGAARAIAAVGSDAAALLLRLKILTGDREPEVISDCLTGLLDVEGAEALPLVESVADSRDEALRDAAILALGASRRADAIEVLKARFDRTADPAAKKCILLALASSRTEAAVEYMIGLIRTGTAATAEAAAEAMSIHRGDARIQAAIEEARAARSEAG